MRLRHTMAACLLCCPAVVFGADPRFNDIDPPGGQRGSTCEVTLSGANLLDLEELLFHEPGIEVLKIGPVERKGNTDTAKATLKIGDSCPLGGRRLSLRTRSGLSSLQIFHVGPFPVVREKEPNDSFTSAQPVEMNVTVSGRITNKDVDAFVLESKKGERISAEVFGMRLGKSSGRTLFDPTIELLDEQGNLLVQSDDTTLLWNDTCISVLAPHDGKYIVQVRDVSYNGDGRADYLLHIGNFPRPLGVIPTGGNPGSTMDLTFIGDARGAVQLKQEVKPPASVAEQVLEYTEKGVSAPTSLPFRFSDLTNFLEQEPNENGATATPGSLPGAFNGVLATAGDVDCYKFSAKKGERYQVEVYARRLRSELDSMFQIINLKDGKAVASNDDRIGVDPSGDFTAPEDGEYILRISNHLGLGNPNFFYRAEVTPYGPNIGAETLEIARYVQPMISIPRGAGFGIMVNVRRDACSGPVQFTCDMLPAGVTIDVPEGWRDTTQIPVVFFADEEAPLGGAVAPLQATLIDPSKPDAKIVTAVTQDIQMTRYVNNLVTWREMLSTVPIVVTEPMPFRCWIETPAVPLVRNGSLDLIVRCERVDGWDGEISLQTLRDAPGTTSSRSVRIAKGQNEARIPINASPNAEIRESMLAIRCSATVENGVRELCTQFVPLRVEEPYLVAEFGQGVVEQGAEFPYLLKLTLRKEFEGEATAELVGLPAKAAAEKVKFTKDTKELQFVVKAAADAPPATSKDVLCRISIPEQGAEVPHQLGSGRVRVDPARPKQAEQKEVAASTKPLSRLDQLRQQQGAAPASSSSEK